MNEKERNLLRKIISEQLEDVVTSILVEEYEDPLAQVFLQPFKDVVDTARHGLEKTSAKIWGNTEKLAKQAATLLVPGLPVDAFTGEIDNNIKSRLGQIDSKYQSVIQRNYDMMRSRDLWGLPFLLNPAMMTGVDMATKAPEFVLSTLEAITGGNPTITKMRERAATINQRVTGGGLGVASGAGWVGGGGGDYGGDMGFENVSRGTKRPLNEQEQQGPNQEQINQILGKQIAKAAQHPTIKNAMKNSKLVQQMKQIAIDSLLAAVQNSINFNSYEEMKSKLSNSKFAQAEQQMMADLPEGATPEQIKEFQQALPEQVKALIKQMYVKQLEALLKKTPEAKEELSSIAKQIINL